ncbi:hypothetical protein [Cellvibrio mixtus]|uniref:hypothetical protein n=1 Tax=Cellvibrio mixtus TaxID=39650 RepID=UPI001BAF08FE|nr:hypothetical protein [Cellvibrio mixtus]
MRYLSLLFFVFLSLCSGFVFAQDPPSPLPTCPSSVWVTGCISGQTGNTCGSANYLVLERRATCTIHRCCRNSSCPAGYRLNKFLNSASGKTETNCVPDDPIGPGEECPNGVNPETGLCNDLCPSGYPKVNGQCPVCPGGFNSDGTCIDPTTCPAGQIKQGEINGTAICKKECSDPNQSWGFVNGVEGCYGSPTCPNGGSYGTVNGVPGCYGGDGGGSGSGSSSGGAGGSSGGAGGSSGGAGGSSGGAGGSSGGSGGDGGSGGNGGGGGGGGSNNDIGSDFGGAEACPAGKIKQGNKCVSDGRGDCTIGYHELVVSRDPYLFICVKDDPPPASSAASSHPSSNSSQASSSPSSQSAASASASAGSGGSGSSAGGGGGGGGGNGDSGAGDCDPTAIDYFKCAGLLEELKNDDLQEMYQGIDDTNSDSLQDYEKLLTDDLQDFDENGGVSFAPNETNQLKSLMTSFLPVATACNPPTLNILGKNYQLDCTYFDTFKLAFGWFLAVLTAFQIWQMAIRPVER